MSIEITNTPRCKGCSIEVPYSAKQLKSQIKENGQFSSSLRNASLGLPSAKESGIILTMFEFDHKV
jgi:hypothetical protein